MPQPIIPSGFTITGSRVDPFATFKFHVEIGNIVEALFSECSGLEIINDIMEYQEGGLNEYSHKLPGRTKLSNVTLKRGFALSNELYKWYQEMEKCLLGGKSIPRKNVTITLYSTAAKIKVMRWMLRDAFPVKWTGPALKADDTNTAIELVEFAHHGVATD